MANVDVTLKLTNPALYNKLNDLVTKTQHINLDIKVNAIGIQGSTLTSFTQSLQAKIANTPLNLKISGLGIQGGVLQSFKQTLQQQLANTPMNVNINPRLGNVTTLQQQITRAIGNVTINVSIGNLAALNNQIQQLFTGLGIQTGNFNNPPRGGFASGQARVRQLGGVLASQIRNEENPVDPRLGNVERTLGVLSGQAGVPGILAEESRRRIDRAADSVARRRAKANAEFQQRSLFEIALLGPQNAAREFEQEKGLRAGTINHQGIDRISFDPGRAFATKGARNELGFAALFGGIPGAVGGAVGGGFFGEGGVFLGSAIFQKAIELVNTSFGTITSTLESAAKAGLSFQEQVNNISIALQSTSKVIGPGGKEASIGESIKFQNNRARSLVSQGITGLAPFGVNAEGVGAGIRGIVAGASRTGLTLSDDQILRVLRPIAGFTATTNEDLIQNIGRFANDVEDFIAGQTNNELSRSLLGSRVGPQLRSAVQSGDSEAFVRAFASLDKILGELSENSDSASFAIRKLNAEFQNTQRSFGDAFDRAIVPGLKSLAKSLDNPRFQQAITELGTGIGNIVNIIIQGAAKIAGFLGKGQATPGAAIGGGIGGLAGAIGGGVAGFGVGGPIGALVGAGLGGFGGAALGATGGAIVGSGFKGSPTAQAASLGNTSGLSSAPNPTSQDINTKLQSLLGRNVDTSTISGRFQSDVGSLAGQLTEGKLSQGLFGKKVNDLVIQGQTDQTLAALNIGKSSLELGALEQDLLPGRQLGFVNRQIGAAAVGEIGGNIVGGAQGEIQSGVKPKLQIIETLPPALERFKLALDESSKSLEDFAGSRKLEGLQGADRLAELAKQIQAAGGGTSLSLARGFSGFETPEDAQKRKLDILKGQFEQESSKLNPFRFDNETRAGQLAKEKTVRDNQLNVDSFGFSSDISLIQKKQELLGFLGKFSGSELEDNIAFPDSKGNIVSGSDVKKQLEGDLAKKFNTTVGSDAFKKIQEKLGSGEPLKDISNKINDLFDQLVQKITEGSKAALDQTLS